MRTRLGFGILSLLLLWLLLVFGESILPLMLMAALVLIVGISLGLSFLFSSALTAEVTADPLSEKGCSLRGTVAVENKSRFPFPVLRAMVETKNLLTGESSLCAVPVAVPPKKKVLAEFAFTSEHCGKVEVSVKQILVFDFFGMIGLPRPRECSAPALILPELFPMDITVVKSGVTEPECDTYSPYKAGNDPSETFGIRDYESGDPLRSIHWKLTGKFDRMVIREAGLPVNESVLILFERICPLEKNFSSPAVRNALGEIMISLSQRLTEMGLAHTVGWLRAENGTFVGHRIDSEESFQLLMAEILSVFEQKGSEDTIEGYLKTNDHDRYSNIVYISSRPSENISLLPMQAKKNNDPLFRRPLCFWRRR